MSKLTRILKDSKGTSTLSTVAIILGLLLIMCVIAELFRLTLIVQGVKDATQSAVIDVVTDNWTYTYDTKRQGYSGGYALNESNWGALINNGSLYYQLESVLGLTDTGEKLTKYTDNTKEFSVYDIDVKVLNTPFKDRSNSQVFSAEVKLSLEVPLSYGFDHLEPIKIPIKLKAKYIPLF